MHQNSVLPTWNALHSLASCLIPSSFFLSYLVCYPKTHLFQEASSDAPRQWVTTFPEPPWSLALAPFIGAEMSPSPLLFLVTPRAYNTEACRSFVFASDWYIFVFFLSFFFGCVACEILIPQSGIEPEPLIVQCLNHWTTREVPRLF